MKRAPLSNTHTIPRAGARSLGNSTQSEPRDQCSPPSGGAGSTEPVPWAGPRFQLLAPSVVRWCVRLAAEGPAQQSHRGSHCILAQTGRGGLLLRRLTVPAGSAGVAQGSKGGVRAWSTPGTVATSFLPFGVIQLSSQAPLGLLLACAARPLRCCESWPARQPHILAVR